MSDLTRCGRAGCGAPIRWAVTEAGKGMPLDAADYDAADERANVAIMRDAAGTLRARVITAKRPLMGYERRAMPHFATCASSPAPKTRRVELPPNVVRFPDRKARP